MTARAATPTVAIIGGGASGTLVAAHLAAAAAPARELDVLLVEPRRPGRGIAYGTPDPWHRLNVPARGMSAWPDDPGHFLRWMRRRVSVDFPKGGFAPRMLYGQYLSDVLDRALAASDGIRFEHVRARATDVSAHGRRLRVTLSNGTSRAADAIVLAIGHSAPSTSWAPAALRRSPLFVTDPWAQADVEPRAITGADVVIVGSGLTAVDMAMRWGSHGVRVHLTSRHGLLPLSHAATPEAPAEIALPDGPLDLDASRRLVFRAVRSAGDWRRAIDGLRPVTSELWRRLSEDDQRRFLSTMVSRWDRVRHRLDPAVSTWLEQRRRDGSLAVHGGGVVDATPVDGRIRIAFGDGTSADAAVVVNCTGRSGDLRTNADPFVTNLFRSGVAQPGPLGIGFAADDDGRLLHTSRARRNLWTIGPLRRGQLWESTAVPEIRTQAAALAAAILAALPAPEQRRPSGGPLDLPVRPPARGPERRRRAPARG